MTSAGPTKTYGRTPSWKRAGSQSTTRFMAQNRPNTPPAPTTMATATTSSRLACWSRRKSNVHRSTPKATSGTASAPSRRRTVTAAGMWGRCPGPPGGASNGSTGSTGGVWTDEVMAFRSPRPFRLRRRPALFDVVQDPRQRALAALHVLHHAGPEAARPDRRGHEVGGVEAGGVGLQGCGQDLGGVGPLLVG